MSTNYLIIRAFATDKSINAEIGRAKVYYAGDDIIGEDGTIYHADGSVVYPDGVIMEANGTIHYTDGSVKMPNGITYFVNGVIEYPSGLRVDANGNNINSITGVATNQITNQSANQTTNPLTNKMTNQTTNQSIKQITNNENTDLTKLDTNDGVWDYDPYTDEWKFKILDANGNMLRIYYNCWIHKINDKGKDSWYAVDENGNMITGFAKYNGDFYYFSQKADSRGELITGEIAIAGNTYVFDENGALKKGKVNAKRFPVIGKKNHISRVDGYWKMSDQGKRSFLLYKEVPGVLRATEIATGWIIIDGYYYSLDEEGIPITGLTIYDDKYYYMEKDGKMLEGGTIYLDGRIYTFDKATGACISIN